MKRFLAGAFSLLLALGAGIRIWYVNTHVDPRFTPPETKVYQMGEWVELEGNFQFSAQECTDGYAVRLESVEFMTPEEYAGKYDLDLEMFRMGPKGEMPEAVADLTLNFRNAGSEEGYIQFVYYRMYSDNDLRSFAPLADVNGALHPEMNERLGFMIYSGTESGPAHFCLVSGVEMSGAITGNYRNFPKYLQISITPVRKVIEIPVPDSLKDKA